MAIESHPSGVYTSHAVEKLHRLNNFDLIRLLAALHVVFSHSIVHSGLYERLSPTALTIFDAIRLIPAVPIFFVISGFLITSSFERSPGNVSGYFWRRVLRIFPALWLALLVSLIILGTAGYLTRDFVFSGTFWAWLAAQVSFIQFWNPEHFRSFGSGVVNGSLWTISVELQYYILVPIWITLGRWLTRIRSGRLMLEAAMFIISIASHLYMRHQINLVNGSFSDAPNYVKALHMTLLPYLWLFMLGVWLQRNFNTLIPYLAQKAGWWVAAWAVAICLSQYVFGDSTLIGTFSYVVSLVLVAFATLSLAHTEPQLSGQLLKGNDISYGVYIYHWLIMNSLLELGFFKSFATVPIVPLLSVIFGYLSWRLLEKPVLSFKNWAPMNNRRIEVASKVTQFR